MNNLNVLVVEDDPDEAVAVKESLQECGHRLIGIAKDLEEALQLYNTAAPDICIIDVYLNGKADGIVFATEINKNKQTRKPFLFLTSAGDSTTFRLAKSTAPYSYLLKPFNRLELQYALELAIEKFAIECTGKNISETNPLLMEEVFFIKKGNLLVKIPFNTIKYIEVEGKYCKIVSTGEKFLVQQALKDLLNKLPATQFFRVHRNYVANIKEVSKIDLQKDEFFFKDGTSLFFSRRYLDDFLHGFNVLK